MSILSEIDYNIVCRTCLSYSKDMKSLYENSSIAAQSSFADILMSFTPLKYLGNDGFPAQICHNCIQELNTSYKFQLKCLDSDDILRKDIERNAKSEKILTESTITEHASQPSDITVNNAYLPLTNVATQKELQLVNVNIKMEAVMDPMNQIYVPGKPLNTPLPFAELQKDLSQDLVLIKDEANLGVKIELEDNSEMQPAKIVKIPEIHSESLSETYNCLIEDNTNVKLDLETFSLSDSKARLGKTLRRKPYSCTTCDKSFTNKTNLTAHIKNHSGQKLYACTFCSSSFTKKKHLIVHSRQMHSGEKPYSCTVCNRRFSEESYLARHIQTHSGKKSNFCLVCTSSFAQKTDLVAHMRTHAQNPFMCTICKTPFKNKSCLKNHMRTHSEEKPYTCTVCKCSFKLKQHLTRHMPTHIDAKQYSCTVCNSSFRNKSNLMRHMHTHSEEKPYSCTVCSCSFIQKQHLMRHMGMHIRENPDS